ncbi:MAG: ferrochelatase, partial [Gammaproteobacteria bacterium]|nr:ferrochelatase [Gammaproteobacteria bacterium]
TLINWAHEGIKNVQICCPGFSADCLETLEEIKVENRDYFLNAGGEKFDYIPALNDNTDHIGMMGQLIKQHASDWLDIENKK